MILRGDIYLVNFDPGVGSEIRKTRPALVIQNNIDNEYSPIVIVVAITSRFGDMLYPTEVFIRADMSGLDHDSVVQLNQVRSIDKRRLMRRLGKLDNTTMMQVDRAILISLGIVDI